MSAPCPEHPVTETRSAAAAATDTLVYESDWLASEPFYYDLRNGRVGHNVNDVIDFANLEFDYEGLNDYLDFGYCVFEHTPVRGVSVLAVLLAPLIGPCRPAGRASGRSDRRVVRALEHGRRGPGDRRRRRERLRARRRRRRRGAHERRL